MHGVRVYTHSSDNISNYLSTTNYSTIIHRLELSDDRDYLL